MKFLYDFKELRPFCEKTLGEIGIKKFSKILVISIMTVIGA